MSTDSVRSAGNNMSIKHTFFTRTHSCTHTQTHTHAHNFSGLSGCAGVLTIAFGKMELFFSTPIFLWLTLTFTHWQAKFNLFHFAFFCSTGSPRYSRSWYLWFWHGWTANNDRNTIVFRLQLFILGSIFLRKKQSERCTPWINEVDKRKHFLEKVDHYWFYR